MGVFDVISKAVVAVDAMRDRVRRGRPAEASSDPVPAERTPLKPAPAVPPPQDLEPSLGDPTIAAQIYGRRSCPWCGRAIQLLQAEGIDYRFVNLDDDEGQPLETALVKETKKYTVPYVFLRGEYVGGYHDLDEIARLGQLERMTTPPDERKERRSGEIEIVIPKRSQ